MRAAPLSPSSPCTHATRCCRRRSAATPTATRPSWKRRRPCSAATSTGSPPTTEEVPLTDRLTPRRLLGTGAAAGAGALLAGAPAEAAKPKKKRKPAPKKRRPRTADVIVVGAGFAGLTAAREIVK